MQDAVASTFATDNMVPELATEEEVAGVSNDSLLYFDFDRQIGRCFLLAMIEMTEEAGVQQYGAAHPAARNRQQSVRLRTTLRSRCG